PLTPPPRTRDPPAAISASPWISTRPRAGGESAGCWGRAQHRTPPPRHPTPAHRRPSVVVGAPRANTSQPGVAQPGAVFLCPWPPGRTPSPLPLHLQETRPRPRARCSSAPTSRTSGWGHPSPAGAAGWWWVPAACAPLQHWNALDGQHEAFRTPTGACFVGAPGLLRVAWYSPCRDRLMAGAYRDSYYAYDKRYCEIGFSAAVTQDGTLVLGAPGGYYFVGKSCLWCHPPPRPFLGGIVLRAHSGRGRRQWGRVRAGTVPPSMVAPMGAAPAWHATGVPPDPKPVPPPPDPCTGCRQDDVLVGAPLFMARRPDGQRSELGRLYLYLGELRRPLARPPQTLTGTHPYGRFAAAIASLGDQDKDGYGDVAVGAPFGGDDGSGQVFIFRGQSEGLEPVPSQRLDSPFPGPAAFGFSLRGATDLDGNGYPDLLVGAYGAAKVAVYQGQPVLVARTQLSVPDGLNPEVLECVLPGSSTRVSCFAVVLCVSVTSQHTPQSIRECLEAELQLDRLKPRLSRRVLLLQGHQASWHGELELDTGTPPACRNLTAYLRDEADFKDKLSPVALSLSLALPEGAPGVVLYGDTLVQAQVGGTRLTQSPCPWDAFFVLSTVSSDRRLLIGAEAMLLLRANASNRGEGAFEAELRVLLPPGTHYQAARSSIPGQEKLSCNPRKENGTHVVLCELGNPMKAGAQITVDMELSVSGLEDMGDAITFQLQLRSNSLPATTVLPVSWRRTEGSRRLEDHGIKVEHIYQVGAAPMGAGGLPPPQCHLTVLPQLHNKGPSTVSGVTLHLTIPSRLGGRILLYLLELGTEGGMNCTDPPGLNTEQVGWTRGGDRRPPVGAGWVSRWGVSVEQPWGCLVQGCGCPIGCQHPCAMSPCVPHVSHVCPQREHLLKQFLIQSQAWFNTSAMPYRVQPRVLPVSGQWGTVVTPYHGGGRSPEGDTGGPRGDTVAVTVSLFQMGFFKRTRPPAEDTQELAPGDAEEPGGAQD
uniref:Integrin subunit alpha 2b n=1 Tax=Strigops habroptila TaxID=2489341 RepID=A0A672UL16_STRHB